MSEVRSLPVLLPALLSVLVGVAPAAVAAEVCVLPDPGRLLLLKSITVTGQSSVPVRAVMPPGTDALVEAVPSSVDVRLEGPPEGGGLRPAADSPIRRWGARRLLIAGGSNGAVDLQVMGKERQGHGTVRIAIAPISIWRDSPWCIAAFRSMAAGGAHYARAEGTPGSEGPAPGVDVAAEYRAAAVDYDAAAEALADRAEDRLFAQALLAAAATRYQDLSAWREAADGAAHAHEVFARIGDSYAAARAGAVVAGAGMELALADRSHKSAGSAEASERKLESVREQFRELAAFHAARGEFFEEALALNQAGLTDYYAGRYRRGMRSYQEALPIYVRLHEYPRESQVLQNIALMEDELGRFPESKRDYVRALKVLGADPNSSLPGEILNNLALVEYDSGDLDSALEHYAEALTILQRLQVPLEAARSVHGLGIVYFAAGDREQALDYLQRALKLRNAEQDLRGYIATLRAMASVLSDLGRNAEAVPLRREALSVAVAPSVRVRIEARLAHDLETLGETTQAKAQAAQAVTESAAAPGVHQALALAARAELELHDAELVAARGDVDRALKLLDNGEAASQQFEALVLAARIARAEGLNRDAAAYLDEALRLAEHIRLESANPELRAGVWQQLRPAFDLKIDLLAVAGTEPGGPAGIPKPDPGLEMLATAEMYRARSLSDYWRHRGVGGGAQDAAAARQKALYEAIADRRFELEARIDRSGEDDPRTRALRADLAALRREADTLHRTTATADAETAQAMLRALRRVAAIVPPDAAVIEYWLGSTRARAWVMTAQGVRMADLGSSDSIDKSARALHAALRNFASAPTEDRIRLVNELSRQVLGPLPEIVRYRSLIVVPDGALHYVPFSVLAAGPSGKTETLVSEHVVAIAPSAAAALWKVPAVSAERILIVDDPVYSSSDPRLPTAAAGEDSAKAIADVRPALLLQGTSLQRLPATAIEAAAVTRLFPRAEVDQLAGLSASRDGLLALDLSRYRIIHIAAHAVTDTQAPLLSALVLSLRSARGTSVPGEVFAGELALQRLDAELVVLSACDTALGRELTGEGLLGLRYAVHAAGARSVLASLWPATDRVTTELMTAFYTQEMNEAEPPARALALAMREIRSKFPDPALWGAFEISAAGPDAIFGATRRQH
jgi:CHAT domain-containing protein/tetratricopeptide (TPR) repeat protein